MGFVYMGAAKIETTSSCKNHENHSQPIRLCQLKGYFGLLPQMSNPPLSPHLIPPEIDFLSPHFYFILFSLPISSKSKFIFFIPISKFKSTHLSPLSLSLRN
ncbi:hypothetical protein HanRHA438_Chr09g0399581 [Helianthus annuus]|nr:hypothetical protein HanRHA438_Chr09g0399581 [Helianthus annuus]